MELIMSEVVIDTDNLVQRIIEILGSTPPDQRLMVGIAGPPGSGKSTLADWVAKEINTRNPDADLAVVVPMDGFHLDNVILDSRGLRAVKGSPDTFDVNGFYQLLQRLASPLTPPANAQMESNTSIYVPLFDRERDLARCAASEVNEHHRIVIVEGNYLLLQRQGWRELAALFNLSVMLHVPSEILEQRLIKRWMEQGMERRAAVNRAMSNDLRNAMIVAGESANAELKFKSMRQ